MRAARMFAEHLAAVGTLAAVERVQVELLGSLGSTGRGHGTMNAVLLGLAGEHSDRVDPDDAARIAGQIRRRGRIALLGGHEIGIDAERDVSFHGDRRLAFHPNALIFWAYDKEDCILLEQTYFSVGGGSVVAASDRAPVAAIGTPAAIPYPFSTAAELLGHTARTGLSISRIMLENEKVSSSEESVRDRLLQLWAAMRQSVRQGVDTEGILPGGLGVRRRAGGLARLLNSGADRNDPLHAMEWVTMFALAVNEQNAGGGRVVTAPTNGAAGVIPAVLHYYVRFHQGASDDRVMEFLLTAGAIGILFKIGASISGAEVGCQGEIGAACAMAAAGLAEISGGTPEQVENAAEIGIEHNLGLTCDPVAGLVQIPCIERNAIAAVKAIAAARMAVRGDGSHRVSLDDAIKTMRETGADMMDKYKETSLGGLALNIVAC